MPRLRRVPFPPETTSASVEERGPTGRRWTRWAVVNQGGKRVGWVTEGPRGGQIYGPGGEAHPGEWTARATDGWSEPGHDTSDDAMVALERYVYG